MGRVRAFLVAGGGVAVLVVVFIVLRPENQGDASPTTDTVLTGPRTSASTATVPGDTTPDTPSEPANPIRIIRVMFRDGQVVGGIQRATLVKGERAALVVDADVPDEIHLHGYDVSKDVAPGKRARFLFKATLVGRFKVELEQRRLQIAEIEVEP